MLRFSSILRASAGATALALALAACSGDDETMLSGTAEPTVELTQTIDERPEGFPCPPFTGLVVAEADVYGDADNDGISNCQEDHIGSDRSNADSDGDGIEDGEEAADLLRLTDTDDDDEPNIIDADDDGDGCPTSEDGLADTDVDGVPAYLDDDESGCETGETGDTGSTTTTTTTTN
jgi:hypothetical protein